MAADAAPSDQPLADQNEPSNPLLLSKVLAPTPPAPLIKDDEPLEPDGSPAGVDRFGGKEIAEHLGRIIEKAEPPYTISLSGSWGVGKTWVAKRLHAILRPLNVPVVWIDLWTEDVSELRRTLAVEVAVKLSGKIGKAEDAERLSQADALDKELRRPDLDLKPPQLSFAGLTTRRALITLCLALIAALLIVVGVIQPIPQPGTGPNLLATSLITIGTAGLIWIVLQSGLVLSVAAPTTSLPPVREAVAVRARIRNLITSHSDRKVLVVLDNLDRLPGDDAVAALGEVRSFVELPKSRCLFLVPLDRDALERHLRKSMGQDAQAAHDYLDKFFNLDVLLTQPAAADLRQSVLDMLTELFPGVVRESLSLVAEVLADAADGSPRAAKRLANGIYARAYMLPAETRNQISLVDVALVEGLLARFPATTSQLADDPTGVARRIEQVRAQADRGQRVGPLLWLIGQPNVAEGDDDSQKARWTEQKWPEVEDLATFLLGATRDISPDGDGIRTILTARPNRQLAGIPDPKAADTAMRTGEPETLAVALAGLGATERHAALTSLLEMVRASLSRRFVLGIRNGVNALAPNVGEDEHVAAMLRRAVADYLLVANEHEFRAFSAESICFFFAASENGLPYAGKIAQRSVASLTVNSALPIEGAVRFVAAAGDRLDGKGLDAARTALAKLEDRDLGPLFEPSASAKLLPGPVCDKYVSQLTAAEWSGDLVPLKGAAERLTYAQEAAKWDGSTVLDPAFAKLTTTISSGGLDATALDTVEKVVALTKLMPPQPSRDALAQALIAFTPGGRRAVELALEIPSTAATVGPALTTALNGMASGADVVALMTSHRAQLEERGVTVSEMAANRWVTGMGAGYLPIALDRDRKESLDLVFSKVAAISDSTIYAGLLPVLAARVVQLASREGAERVFADLAGRVNTLGATVVAGLAASVAKLQDLASPSEVVAAMSGLVGRVRREEIPMATAATRSFVEAGVTGANELPVVVSRYGAGLGAVDLGNMNWLLEQPNVSANDVIVGLRGSISTEPFAAVHAALEGMHRSRRKRADIGKALIERAASEPVGSRQPWLKDATANGVPSSPEARREYRDALRRASEGDPGTNEPAALLWDKL